MAFSSCFIPFFSLFFLFQLLISSSSSPTPITIPLSFSYTNSYADLYQKLSHLASTSLARAHHLKKIQNTSAITSTPLLPHSYGGYSISLSFGTPPQFMSLVMDTGSDFVWFPCTKRYACKDCSFRGLQGITSFSPKQSSSVKIVGCLNKKCGWLHTGFESFDPRTRCSECHLPNAKNCTQICPPYLITYGSGTTGGIGIIETLDLPNKKVANFLVGCSLFSSRQPAGIAGFGRGLSSLPSQLGLKKFSYCLLPRRYDDTGESSSLILDGESNSDKKTGNLSYTSFEKNPIVAGKSAFQIYYYVGLRKISVGGKNVKIRYKYLVPDSEGSGGTIVDSGSTFTYMNSPVFEPVIAELTKQVKFYKRAEKIESLTGLRPCFNISGHKSVHFPELKFHFKGGAEMKLPLPNYFAIVGANEVVCLTIVSDNFGQFINSGPSIVLGSFQMQNFNVEYDLKNERFGFMQHSCKTK